MLEGVTLCMNLRSLTLILLRITTQSCLPRPDEGREEEEDVEVHLLLHLAVGVIPLNLPPLPLPRPMEEEADLVSP